MTTPPSAPGAQTRRIDTSDGTAVRVLVNEAGDAIPFLLVHGLGSNARLWDGVAETLAGFGHPSVAIDQRGHGESDKVDHGFDFPTLVSDLATVVEATVDRSVVVAGQSWGGNVALELAAARPDLVAGVVGVDGGFIKLAESFPDWATASTRLAPPRLEGVRREVLESSMRDHLVGFPDGGIAAQLANFEDAGDGTVRKRLTFDRHMTILRFLWEHDPDALAVRVHQPVMVIAATGGFPGHDQRVSGFVERLQRGSVVWMDAHHDMHAQYPEDIGRLLHGFAREIAPETDGASA